MRKVVIRLSPLAKIAVTVAMVGAALSLYGKMQGVAWANGVGTALLFGGAIVYLGQRAIGIQTGFWLVFGAIYLTLGVAMLFRLDRVLRHRIGLAPERWRTAGNPVLQGLAFGFNIPACAAPILFALIGALSALSLKETRT